MAVVAVVVDSGGDAVLVVVGGLTICRSTMAATAAAVVAAASMGAFLKRCDHGVCEAVAANVVRDGPPVMRESAIKRSHRSGFNVDDGDAKEDGGDPPDKDDNEAAASRSTGRGGYE